MEESVYSIRMEKVRGLMSGEGIDVFLVSPSSNMFYLSGYGIKGDERLLLFVLPQDKKPFILANLLYKEQVKSLPVASLLQEDFIFWKDGDDPFLLLKAEIEKRKIPIKKAALEPQIPALFSLPLGSSFPQTNFVLGSSLTDPLR